MYVYVPYVCLVLLEVTKVLDPLEMELVSHHGCLRPSALYYRAISPVLGHLISSAARLAVIQILDF